MHTWHGRAGSAERKRSLQSVSESDIGHIDVCEQPTGANRIDFYIDTLRRLRKDAAFLLRLEDDILVNRHVIHNVLRWRGFDEPHFGAGWLSVPSNYAHDMNHTGRGTHGTIYRKYHEMNFGGGIIIPSAVLDDGLLLDVERHMKSMPTYNFTPVRSLSNVMHLHGLRVYFHYPPSLVFMDLDALSYPGRSETRKYTDLSLSIMRPQDFRIDWRAE